MSVFISLYFFRNFKAARRRRYFVQCGARGVAACLVGDSLVSCLALSFSLSFVSVFSGFGFCVTVLRGGGIRLLSCLAGHGSVPRK